MYWIRIPCSLMPSPVSRDWKKPISVIGESFMKSLGPPLRLVSPLACSDFSGDSSRLCQNFNDSWIHCLPNAMSSLSKGQQ